MGLQLTNTLTGRKEPFVPRDAGKVGMYLCGPTVYDEPHIGNLRNVVLFDVLRRHLTASGFEVLLVRNYTDVDDRIINASGHDPLAGFVLAEHWTRVYEDVTAALGVLPPDIAPRATGHIPEMLKMVAQLLDAGLAYQAGGDVFFAVGKFPEYGRLARKDLAELRAGERVEVNPDKRDPLDFVLWKAAKPGEPVWDSPWGPGRPGWHLECSAMAAKYLGAGFDIHGGGEDLVFPHHENEIAQYQGATGRPFARVWIHNAYLTTRGEKMSKSLGNITGPRELLRHHPGVVLRYLLLTAHYRSPLELSPEVLADAAAAYDRLATFAVNASRALAPAGGQDDDAAGTHPPGPEARAAHPEDPDGAAAAHLADRFVAALDDDLNVPAALAALFELVNTASPLIGRAERGDAAAAAELQGWLGTFVRLAARLGFQPLEELPPASLGPPLLDLILELRERARAQRDFAAADVIRRRLGELGVRVEDRAGGPRWHLAR
ncbi:MAG TPA: cysteine--tRNA ligase [Actinomycetes bacterium]|nr:cysteine--tRNA ligase [Actinomycetes bacterium]